VDLESTDANVVASLLKQYLRELPDSLLTSRLQDRFEMITSEYPEIRVCVLKKCMTPLNKYTYIGKSSAVMIHILQLIKYIVTCIGAHHTLHKWAWPLP